MWIKRSTEEILKADRRRRLTPAIFVPVFAVVFTVLGIFIEGGWETVETGKFFVPAEERLSRSPRLIILGVIIGIILVKFAPPYEVVCPRCNKTKRWDRVARCECGGRFEKLEHMKWIDEK